MKDWWLIKDQPMSYFLNKIFSLNFESKLFAKARVDTRMSGQ